MLTNVMKKAYLNKVYNALPIRLTSEWRMKIACQFALESDFGRSRLAVSSNNHCGMKVPVLRVTTATNISSYDVGSFASYDSFESCLSDYLIWLAYNKVNSYSQWEKSLRIYCPESDYYNRINSIYKQFKK